MGNLLFSIIYPNGRLWASSLGLKKVSFYLKNKRKVSFSREI
jgi:hypothetical protein